MATGGSLNSNPPNSDISINHAATDWLWAIFALMLVSDLVFIFWSLTKPLGTRIFHQIPVVILTTASIAYFSLASDLGGTPVAIEFNRGYQPGSTRAIWYVRYIDWTITTPFLLLELLLATGLPLSEILVTIFFDLVMIISGLVGALVVSQYKWGYFVFGVAAQFLIWWYLLVKAPASTVPLGNEIKRSYTYSAYFLSVVWLLYPIAWGVADGGNVISPLKEMIFYGVLDIVAKPVFCFYHVWQLRNIPYDRFLLSSGKFSIGAGGSYQNEHTRQFKEKEASIAGRNSNVNAASAAPAMATGVGAEANVAPGVTSVTSVPQPTVGSLQAREGMQRRPSGTVEAAATGAQ